jgi:hypothetical protein
MISIRIYKDIPQGKLVVNFRNFTSACACLPVRVRTQTGRVVHKRSSLVILSYAPWL